MYCITWQKIQHNFTICSFNENNKPWSCNSAFFELELTRTELNMGGAFTSRLQPITGQIQPWVKASGLKYWPLYAMHRWYTLPTHTNFCINFQNLVWERESAHYTYFESPTSPNFMFNSFYVLWAFGPPPPSSNHILTSFSSVNLTPLPLTSTNKCKSHLTVQTLASF